MSCPSWRGCRISRDPTPAGRRSVASPDLEGCPTCGDHIFHGERRETFPQPVPSPRTCRQEVPEPTHPLVQLSPLVPGVPCSRIPQPTHPLGAGSDPRCWTITPRAEPQQMEVLIPCAQDGRPQSVLGAGAELSAMPPKPPLQAGLLLIIIIILIMAAFPGMVSATRG